VPKRRTTASRIPAIDPTNAVMMSAMWGKCWRFSGRL
jgi:hypothetical protein